jgi:hypothetical protein
MRRAGLRQSALARAFLDIVDSNEEQQHRAAAGYAAISNMPEQVTEYIHGADIMELSMCIANYHDRDVWCCWCHLHTGKYLL